LRVGGTFQLKVGWAVLTPFPFFVLISYVFSLHHGVLAATVGYMAYLALILVHELGHATLAWTLGFKVVAIELHLFHGRCWIRPGKDEISRIAVYWGGVLAQIILFAVAFFIGVTFKIPNWLAPAFFMCTAWNIILIASNLSPRPPYDGAVAWRIFPVVLKLVRLRLNLPVRISGSPLLRNEVDLVSYLLTTLDLRRHLEVTGMRSDQLQASLATVALEQRGSVSSLMKVVQHSDFMRVPEGGSSSRTPANLFCAQMRYGNPGVRMALESVGLDVRGLLFRIAHGKSESECATIANEDVGETIAVAVVNDDYTPMELVVQLLVKHLCITREDAMPLMLKIHQSGSATIRVCSPKNAQALVIALNADARQQYAPLLCRLAPAYHARA